MDYPLQNIDHAIHCLVLPAVLKTTFYEIFKILNICSTFRESVCINRVVHIFWDRTSFVFPLFPRKEAQNFENF